MLRLYDYDTIVERLTDRIVSKADGSTEYEYWKDMWESSTGRIFIEMLSAGIEHLGYYLERRVVENYMNTAVVRSSIYNLAAELGYTPRRSQAAHGFATVEWKAPLTKMLLIPRGSTVNLGNYLATTFSDYVIPPGVVLVGTGDAATVNFIKELTNPKAGTVKIYLGGVEVGGDTIPLKGETTGTADLSGGHDWASSPESFQISYNDGSLVTVNLDEDIQDTHGQVEGNIDLSTGHDWSSSPESFLVKYNTGSDATISLDQNCANLAAIISMINDDMPVGTEAYDAGSNHIGLRTTVAGQGETITVTEISGLITLGIEEGTYYGANALDNLVTMISADFPEGVEAVNTDDEHLTIRTVERGSVESFTLVDVDALITLGLTAGTYTGLDAGSGVITGTTLSGTIDYETSELDITFDTAPANGVTITTSYSQLFEIELYQGEFKTYELPMDVRTSDVTPLKTLQIGVGNGSLDNFSGTIINAKAGLIEILSNSTVVARDNGLGIINQISGSGVSGTVNYATGLVDVTYSTPPSVGTKIYVNYYGVVLSPSSLVSYVELPDDYSIVSEYWINMYTYNSQIGSQYIYTLAQVGVPRARAEDRLYWPRYSYKDRLRFYYGDGVYGRNPSQDGDILKVEYLITDGAAGNTSSELTNKKFETGSPVDSLGDVLTRDDPDSSYTITIGIMTQGRDPQELDDTRTNAINLYSTGLRSVTKKDWKYWIEEYPGVSKASVWAEEDVNPPNIKLRNTVKYSAVDENCEDIDKSFIVSTCTVDDGTLTVTDATADFTAAGVVSGDKFLIDKYMFTVDTVGTTTLTLTSFLGYDITDPTLYHITHEDSPLSQTINEYLKDYRTITVYRVFEPPTVNLLHLDIEIDVVPGSVPSIVLADVNSNLMTTFHPTYFEFSSEIAKSAFWDVVMDTPGVKTATIAWSVEIPPAAPVPILTDYWSSATTGEALFREIAKLSTVDVSLRT